MRETKLALTGAEGSRNDVHWMIKLSVRKLCVHKLSVHHSRNAKYIDGFRMKLQDIYGQLSTVLGYPEGCDILNVFKIS